MSHFCTFNLSEQKCTAEEIFNGYNCISAQVSLSPSLRLALSLRAPTVLYVNCDCSPCQVATETVTLRCK